MFDITKLHEEIRDVVESCCIVVFTKTNCVYCEDIKKVLQSQVTYEYRTVYVDTLNISYSEFIDSIIEHTPVKSFPICFMNREFIENDDLKKKLALSFKEDDINDI